MEVEGKQRISDANDAVSVKAPGVGAVWREQWPHYVSGRVSSGLGHQGWARRIPSTCTYMLWFGVSCASMGPNPGDQSLIQAATQRSSHVEKAL